MSTAPVLVIGMHRSGTSCLAGCLEDLGLSMGDIITEAPHNAKGNRENPRLWDVHDAVLARVDAAWDRPPLQPVVWTQAERSALSAVLADYDGLDAPWGCKDPRATVLLDGWLEVVPEVRLVASIRNPLAVAGSLQRRDGFDLPTSLGLWSAYNRLVRDWSRRVDIAVIDYDDPDYAGRVGMIATGLGLEAKGPLVFREDGLNHNSVTDQPPAEVAALWDELQGLAA